MPDETMAFEQNRNNKVSKKGRTFSWVRDILIAVVIAVLILQFVKPTIVREHSMENTLHEYDYIFLSKQAYTFFGDVEHGDIIVFHTDIDDGEGHSKNLIKRAIGLPGDTIEITGGNVIRNGKVLDEKYTKDGYTDGEMEEITVPEGKVFAMGDNRQSSLDSRNEEVGMVDMDLIIGKAVFRIYPLNSFGTVD